MKMLALTRLGHVNHQKLHKQGHCNNATIIHLFMFFIHMILAVDLLLDLVKKKLLFVQDENTTKSLASSLDSH